MRTRRSRYCEGADAHFRAVRAGRRNRRRDGAGAEAAAVLWTYSCLTLRIVAHPRLFAPPTPVEAALAFAEAFRTQPNSVLIAPGGRHGAIFATLCRDAGAQRNLIPDAYLAALAIESGCEFITTDRDFSRFPGLRWRVPF